MGKNVEIYSQSVKNYISIKNIHKDSRKKYPNEITKAPFMAKIY